TRQLSFDTVLFCIDQTNEMLVRNERYYGEAGPYIREFWSQYWGEMILVEGQQVTAAMVNYGNVLNELRVFALTLPAAAPPDPAKPPLPTAPPTARPTDAKGDAPPPTLPAGARPPANPPAPNPKPAPPEVPLSAKESSQLDELKRLPQDQLESFIRQLR